MEGGGEECVRARRTHGLESAFFGFRDALSGSDIADCEKGREKKKDPQQGNIVRGMQAMHELVLVMNPQHAP
jgi:hypothetical protein